MLERKKGEGRREKGEGRTGKGDGSREHVSDAQKAALLPQQHNVKTLPPCCVYACLSVANCGLAS